MKRFRRRSGTGLLLDTKDHTRNNLINYNEISFYLSGKDVVIGKWKEAFSDDYIPAATPDRKTPIIHMISRFLNSSILGLLSCISLLRFVQISFRFDFYLDLM